MAKNKRLTRKSSNRVYAKGALYTKKINKQTSENRPGGGRF